MPIESDDDRLALVSLDDGEEFETTAGRRLWALPESEALETLAGTFQVNNRRVTFRVRSSDVADHELVKGSVLRRVVDDVPRTIRELIPDNYGMTLVVMDK